MNDKLRDALTIVEKYGMKGDVIYKEIEALAASKQEPQAQAGEPEPLYEVDTHGRLQATKPHSVSPGDKFITLQSNREDLEAQRKAIEFEAWEYRERIVPELREENKELLDHLIATNEILLQQLQAIAKKDAALVACVEAGKAVADADDAGELTTELVNNLRSAITQAKEARK